MPSGKEASMDNEGGAAAAASSLELLSAVFILAIVAC